MNSMQLSPMVKFQILTAVFFMQFYGLFAMNEPAQEPVPRQTEVVYQSTYGDGQPMGYLEYLPPHYDSTQGTYPLIISLHGLSHRASGDKIEFDKLREGGQLAKRIEAGKAFPFIIITPQQPEVVKGQYQDRRYWDPHIIDEVLERVKRERRVDLERIYICGESMGGGGVWQYLALYGDKIAAAVPISGTSTIQQQAACNEKIKNTPIWAFHCDEDPIVNVKGTVDMIHAINRCQPAVRARQTIYRSRSHNAWDWAYDNVERNLSAAYGSPVEKPVSGMGDIFTWFLSHRKSNTNRNVKPVAQAGPLQEIVMTEGKVQLDGSASYDPDGSVIAYQWKQIEGPVVDNTSFDQVSPLLQGLQDGTYQFTLTVEDNQGGQASDTVKVIVHPVKQEGHGLRYTYFEGEWNTLPDFRYVTPKKSGVVDHLSLEERLREDYFGFVFQGEINIITEGYYHFYLDSDEGSQLWIDQQLVVDNNGIHLNEEKAGKVYLRPGMHPIRLLYFERMGTELLALSYEGPDFAKKQVPEEVLYPGKNNDFSAIQPYKSGLYYWYYDFEEYWYQLPDFGRIKPKKEGVIPNFSLDTRDRDEKFAYRYKGYLAIEEEGEYTFYTTSDDGSKLYINQELIVDNDGEHAAREVKGSVWLQPGLHAIELTFFQQLGREVLQVNYSGPGFSKHPIPSQNLFISGENPTLFCGDQHSAQVEKSVKAYPSHLENELFIEYVSPDPETFHITMFDQNGKVYFVGTTTLDQNQSFRLDLLPLHLPRGLVYLRMIQGAEEKVIRLFKL